MFFYGLHLFYFTFFIFNYSSLFSGSYSLLRVKQILHNLTISVGTSRFVSNDSVGNINFNNPNRFYLIVTNDSKNEETLIGFLSNHFLF